jgi:hypothetical protein
MNELATDATTCQWPNVVRVGYFCTGVYIGNGLVLTAAHCLEGDNISGGIVTFGENSSSSQGVLEIDVEQAIAHPDGHNSTSVFGEDSYDGVDLAILILESEWPGPVAPVMRIGCESNWLNYAFFNLDGPFHPKMRAVGMGCNEVNYNIYPPCVEDGQKRIWNTWLDQHFPQIQYHGSTKLLQTVPPWLDDHPVEEGDSGSPLFVRMPDGTWRVIGVCHGTKGNWEVLWQPVPPFVDWIEDVTNRSISVGVGSGILAHPLANGSWSDSCSDGEGIGQACGGGPFILPPGGAPLGSLTTPQAPAHVESWIIEGVPQLQRFTARLNVKGELIDVRWDYGSPFNPLQLIANAINAHPILRKEQIFAVVEGSWLKTNGTLKFEHLQIPGGHIRRRHSIGDGSEAKTNDTGGFLNGKWDTPHGYTEA